MIQMIALNCLTKVLVKKRIVTKPWMKSSRALKAIDQFYRLAATLKLITYP